jgi:hypothetical protein
VELTNVVARGPPLISITEVALKPVPVKVRSGAVVAPAATLVGATVVITGNGFTIEYAKTLDVPPFGGAGGGAAGLVTAMDSEPAVATSAVVRATCRIVLFMKPVDRFVLFTLTTDCGAKLEPVRTNVTPADPASTVVGEMDVIVGTLLGAGVIVKVREVADVPPPGVEVNTTTVAVPGLAIRLAGTLVVIWLVLRKVVTSALPFHSTSEPGEKLLPVTVKVNAVPPACAVVGIMDLSDGFGKLICCSQAGSRTTASRRTQKLRPSFRCKQFIPKSLSPLFCLKRNRRDY